MFRLKVRALIGDVTSKALELGFAGFAGYVAKRLFRAVVFRKDVLLVFVRNQATSDEPQRHFDDPYDLRWLDTASLQRCQVQQPAYLSSLRVRERETKLMRGDRCFALFENERLLTLGWVGLRSAIEAGPEVGPRFSVPVNELLPVIYDCWTAPECRRRGYYAIALGRIAVGLVHEYRQVWTYCLGMNVALREESRKRVSSSTSHMSEPGS